MGESMDEHKTRKNIRILIAEHDPEHAWRIAQSFKSQTNPWHTDFAQTLPQALEQIAATPPDLVLADMDLPGGRGVELIPSPYHPAPYAVIMMASHGGENAAVEAMKAGALDYVVKTPESLGEIHRITERALREWRLMRERKALEEQLRQSQKMESIGQLAGGIAHDFSNLLTAIIGYADLTMIDLSDEEATLDNLQQIHMAGVRASQLTSQLLSFARKQILTPKIISLNELIMNLERMLRRLISEDIELVILPGDDLWHVKADTGLLEQVIVNLVVNAGHAMPMGGTLTLETSNMHLADGKATPHAEIMPGDFVTLRITDTGIGMTDEVKSHIFEPFFTTKNRGEGTGLGLATCYGIVRQSEGHIVFDSELNRGTTFRILLPRTLEPAESRNAAQKRALPRGEETILVVEDEIAVRGFTMKALRSLGYTVLEAANGPEAVRITEEYPDEIHLLLTDMVMPQMSGKNVADEVMMLRPGTKILFTSGYMAGAVLHLDNAERGVQFLQKPYTTAILAHKVREVIDATKGDGLYTGLMS